MQSNWGFTSLYEIMAQSEEQIDLEPNMLYKQITVKMWGQGVVLRGEKTGAEIASSRQFLARPSQFIISRIDARNGASGLVPEFLDGAVVTNDFPVFDLNLNKVDPRFLAYLSKTPNFVELCKAASEGTTNRVRLKIDRFLAMQIPLPPLDEQRRIVAHIEALAVKIEEARDLRRKATEETEVIFSAALRSYIDNSMTPKWQHLTLENACNAIIDYRGKTPNVAHEGVIPYITSSNIRNGKINWDVTRYFTEDEYRRHMTRGFPKVGDVIFTMEAPLGETGLIEDDRIFGLGQRLLLLSPNPSVLTGSYLSRVLMSPSVREMIYLHATGTTVKGIASKRLQKIKLPIPPLHYQEEIVRLLDILQIYLNQLHQARIEAAYELDALLPSVLDKAFRGEL